MGDNSVGNVRNIAIIAHHGAGKTSLASAMLYVSGAIDRPPRAEDAVALLDYEESERKRHMSINVHMGFCTWNGGTLNILDTPGFANFLYETESALRVVDAAVVLVSALSGVKTQTEKYWQMVTDLGLPRILFMNKIDRERANFNNAVADIEKDLGIQPVALTIPIGEEENVRGVVDLIARKAIVYDGDGKGSVAEVPAEMAEEVESWREKVIETVAETDDELLERYLNGETFDDELIYRVISEGVQSGRLTPLVVGSATRPIGVDVLMDAVFNYLPSPLYRPSVKGTDLQGQEVERKPDPDAPLAAAVFKTISDPYAGKISVLRVFSGTLKPDSTVYNSTRRTRERIGHLSKLIGKKQHTVSIAKAGDVVAVNKLKETVTGDTLCDESSPIVIDFPEAEEAVISYAIQPQSRGDEDKLMISLAKIREEDPTIQFKRDEQTGEFLISGSGQVHVEVIVEKLKSTYGVSVDMKTPKVPYKETIKGTAKAEGKYIKQTGGRGQYGDAWIEIEPLPRGAGYEFVDKIVGGVIPRNFIPSVEKGIREAMKHGVLAGYPVTDVRVTLFDGKHHPVDSSDIAFQIAGSMAFKKAMESAQPVLLEPIMSMEIITPDDCLGDVIGDINARRGKVSGVEPQAGGHLIKALVPMAEVLTYAPELRSITSGRGMFTMLFSHYDEVPGALAAKIIEESRAEKKEGAAE